MSDEGEGPRLEVEIEQGEDIDFDALNDETASHAQRNDHTSKTSVSL